MPTTPSTRPWKVVLSRVLLDMAIGVFFGAAFWTFDLISEGNLKEAIQDNIADGFSTLQGLAYLGALIGAPIGLLHGLAMMQRFRNQENNDSLSSQ